MPRDNIVGFDQPAEFYYNSALKYLEDFNYIDALPYLRKAAEKDPRNPEYLTALAEALTEIGRFDESNSIILDLLSHGTDDPELFFGMGCNFIGLGDMERAGDCFEQYTAAGEEGEFYYDAMEFLQFIEDYKADESDPGLYDVDVYEDGETHVREAGQDMPANVEKAAPGGGISESDISYVKQNMALALYYEGRIDEAVEVAEEILKKEPENIFAICNLILLSSEKHDLHRMTQLLAKLDTIKTDNPDEIFKKAVTYCDITLHEKAYKEFKDYLAFKPYDTDILFMTGIAAANSGEYKEAVDYLMRCLKIDPDDYASSYYLAEVRRKMESGGYTPEFDYSKRLPDEEAERRLDYINECFDGTREDVFDLWNSDPRFKEYLIWGLYNCDNEYRLAVASVIADFGDDKGERILRKYILDPSQPDEVKDQIFIMLKKMGATEPYRAYLGGNIVEISVSEAPKELSGEDKKDE